MKLSNAVVDKRKLGSENPCTNRVVLCRETDCDIGFWKVNALEHYKTSHPQVIPEEIPTYVCLRHKNLLYIKMNKKDFNLLFILKKKINEKEAQN